MIDLLKRILLADRRWATVARICILVVWLCLMWWHGTQGWLVAGSDGLYYHCVVGLIMIGMFWPRRRTLDTVGTDKP